VRLLEVRFLADTPVSVALTGQPDAEVTLSRLIRPFDSIQFYQTSREVSPVRPCLSCMCGRPAIYVLICAVQGLRVIASRGDLRLSCLLRESYPHAWQFVESRVEVDVV
jgi:hypothetical protein